MVGSGPEAKGQRFARTPSTRAPRVRGETASDPASFRVARVLVRRFADLDPARSREHKQWSARIAAAVEDGSRRGAIAHSGAIRLLAEQLLQISLSLDAAYGTPDLGNKVDPVDELVYIILSRRTREGAYQAAYKALKKKYRRWEQLAEAAEAEIESVIAFSGLGRRKARSLKRALGALVDRFGKCTLEPTRSWTDDTTRDFLCQLPEVGPKSAACVMVCSLDRPAFPVDAHVGRVLARLGIFRGVGIELVGTDHKAKQRLLWDAVPPVLRYALHVNLLVHGRVTCLPRKPRCDGCVLLAYCEHGQQTRPQASRASNR